MLGMWFFLAFSPFLPQSQGDLGRKVAEGIERLGGGSIEDRAEAARMLEALGRAAIPHLEKHAETGDREVRSRVQEILSLIQGLHLLSPRVARLLPGLEKRIKARDDHAWTEAFLRGAWRYSTQFRGAGPIVKQDLERIAPVALAHARDFQEKGDICEYVGELGLRTVTREIVALLGDDHPDIRLEALLALWRLKAWEHLPNAAPCLFDDDRRVRSAAAKAFFDMDAVSAGRLHLPRVTSRIVKLLPDRTRGRRAAAVRMLGHLRARGAFGTLERLLDDPDLKVRAASADVLGRLGHRKAISKLRKMMTSGPDSVRASAASGLCRLGEKEGALPLLRAVRSGEEGVTLNPLNALRTPGSLQMLHRTRVELTFDGSGNAGKFQAATRKRLEIWNPQADRSGVTPQMLLSEFWQIGTRRALRILDMLASYENTWFVVDPDRIRLLSRLEALRFWSKWVTNLEEE